MTKPMRNKRISAKAGRKAGSRAPQRRGHAIPGKTTTADQKLAADEIRRAVDDGMQDLRMTKPD